MVRVPDAATHRARFAALPLSERRAVLRAVNRGRAVEARRHAGHAVVIARRQRRLWSRLWLAGPLIGLTQLGLGWQAAAASAVVSTLMMGLLARFWWRRATRAEEANLALTRDGRRRG